MSKNVPTLSLNIEGETYLLTFGLHFLQEMNKRYYIEREGFRVEMGLQKIVTGLQMSNGIVLKDIIECATALNAKKPTLNEIESFIFEERTEKDEHALFESFFNACKKLPGARQLLKTMKEEQEALDNK